MENELSELELNIKAIEKLGWKVKNNSCHMVSKIGDKDYFQLKDLDTKKGIVSFYFAAFNNKDSDRDIILPGSYKKTIKENFTRIKHLYNHSRVRSPGVLKELAEDSHGAYAVSQLIPSTLGKDILIEYEYGVITEHSQGFVPIKEREDAMQGANIMSEIKLWEVTSLTAWGANHMTPVRSVKEGHENLMKNIEDILKDSDISEERALELFQKLEEIKSFYKTKLPEPEQHAAKDSDSHFYDELLKNLNS